MSQIDVETITLLRIADDPRYHELVRARARFSWVLSTVVVTIFFGYMLLVAFAGPLLARPVGAMRMTVGIPIGLGVIVSGVLLTGLYVWIANRRFDPMQERLLREYRS